MKNSSQNQSQKKIPKSIHESQEFFYNLCFNEDSALAADRLPQNLSTEMRTHIAAQEYSRRTIYRDLVYHGIFSMIQKALPLTLHFMGEENSKNLIRQFLSTHKPRSPHYRHIPYDFMHFIWGEVFEPHSHKIKKVRDDLNDFIPNLHFLPDLMDYEFCRYDLLFRKNLKTHPQHNLETPLEETHAVLNPNLFLKKYSYAVWQISEDNLPKDILAKETDLVIFRNPENFSIHDLELTPEQFYFLNHCQSFPDTVLSEALNKTIKSARCESENSEQALLEFLWRLIRDRAVLALQ